MSPASGRSGYQDGGDDPDSSFRLAAALSAALWLLSGAIYILLRSNQFTDVDGAMRCLQIYWRRPPYLGSNNHMLHPINVWLWSQLTAALGIAASEPIGFMHTIAAMNAVFASGSVALVNFLVWRFTRRWKLSVVCALAYGLSSALIAHATNSAEPVVGLFVSLIAIVVVVEGLSRRRLALLFAGGVCLAFALANYESMLLVAPLLYLVCLIWPTEKVSPDQLHSESVELTDFSAALWLRAVRVIACGLGTLIGAVVIYGTAYYFVGIRAPNEMFQTFLSVPGSNVYGGVHWATIVNVPLGLVANMVAVLPANYGGLKSLFRPRSHALSIVGIAGASAVVLAALSLLASGISRVCRTRTAKFVGLALAAAFSIDLFPVIYWGPLYDKLWLQPIAVGLVLAGVVTHWTDTALARRISVLAIVLIAIEALVNVPRALSARVQPTVCLGDAQKVAGLVGPKDKVVTDFDKVSTLWMGLYEADPSRTLVFPATSPGESLATLDRWTKECSVAGCRIFFVSLLNQPREIWDAFLGKRLKVPFDSVDRYRRGSRIVQQFVCEDSGLRVFEPSSK